MNTRGSLLLAQAFAAQHDGGPAGASSFFTSGQYHGAMPDELPYIASKGALHQLTGSVAAHLMPRGITVNCVEPGAERHRVRRRRDPRVGGGREPRRRWSTPSDTARLMGWLVSDEADWVTGQIIASDGGFSSL